MKRETNVKLFCAVLLIVSSIALASYQTVYEKDIAGGVLMYIAQAFLLAGSIFGLDYYVHRLTQRHDLPPGARARVTYVQGRENDRYLTENRPSYSTPARHHRPTINVPSTHQRQHKSKSSARMERTMHTSAVYEWFANHLRVIWESLAPS